MSEEVEEGKLGDGYYQDSYVKWPEDKRTLFYKTLTPSVSLLCFWYYEFIC